MFNLDARWDGWSAPRPGRFTPWKDPVPIVQEVGLTPGQVWTGAENLAPTGIRSQDRPARSESLYRLSYRGPHKTRNVNEKVKSRRVSVTVAAVEMSMYVTYSE